MKKRKHNGPNNLLLKDTRIYFPRNAILSEKQHQILCTAIEKHGGILVHNMLGCDIILLAKTSVLARCEWPSIDKALHDKQSINCVDISWVQACFRHQTYMPTTDFEVKSQPVQAKPEKPILKQAKIEIPSYACQRITTEKGNLNSNITTIFHQMEKFYDNRGDMPRQLAYRRVLAVVKCYPRVLTRGHELSKIQYVGRKMVAKIDEIIETGTLSLLPQTKTKEATALTTLTNIHGVGSTIAQKWVSEGVYTIPDLQKAVDQGDIILTKPQKIGLQHYNDLLVDLTVKDRDYIESQVRKTVQSMYPNMEILVVGGTRRGKPGGHDMDILLRNDPSKLGHERLVLSHILNDLPMLQHTFNTTSTDQTSLIDSTTSHYDHPRSLALADIGKDRPLRRVDLVMVPSKDWPFAVLGWTGSRHFEQSIRQFAKDTKNWHLNNHGLFHVSSGSPVSISIKTEEDIFKALTLEYRSPNERCC